MSSFWGYVYNRRGMAAVILYSLLSALEFLLVKLLFDSIHPVEIMFLQFASNFLVPVLAMVSYRISPRPSSRFVGSLLVLRGVMGFAAVCTIYYAFKYISVGDAVAISSGTTIFIAVAARIFLKERLRSPEIVAVFVAVGGMFLVAQPPFIFGYESGRELSSIFGISLTLLSCLISTMNALAIRKLGLLGVSNFVVVLHYAIISSLGTAVLTSFLGAWTIPDCGRTRYVVVALILCCATQQNLVTYALAIEKAVYVAILRSTKVIFAFLLELWWFGVKPTWPTLVGAALVFIATVMMSVSKEIHQNSNSPENDSAENNATEDINLRQSKK